MRVVARSRQAYELMMGWIMEYSMTPRLPVFLYRSFMTFAMVLMKKTSINTVYHNPNIVTST